MPAYNIRLVCGGLLILTVGQTPAQNLVPNPSFEEFSIPCSSGASYSFLEEWTTPNCADGFSAYHACNAPQSLGSTPGNLFGWQQPHSGAGYCRVAPFSAPVPGGNAKKYGSVPLTQPLIAGEEYCIRFYLSLADSSSYTTSVLHAFLWYGPPSVCNYNDTAWDTYAAVTFDITQVDTTNWTLIEGSFTAQGGETYLTLGSFLYGAEIDTTYLGTDHEPWPAAAYYIDDVYLGACDNGIPDLAGTAVLELYPNPAYEMLTVRCPWVRGSGSITVLNSLGQVVLEQVCEGGSGTIDVSGLDNGIYMVRFQDSSPNTPSRVGTFIKATE